MVKRIGARRIYHGDTEARRWNHETHQRHETRPWLAHGTLGTRGKEEDLGKGETGQTANGLRLRVEVEDEWGRYGVRYLNLRPEPRRDRAAGSAVKRFGARRVHHGAAESRGERREARGERGITNYDFRGTIGEEAGLPAVGLAKVGGEGDDRLRVIGDG